MSKKKTKAPSVREAKAEAPVQENPTAKQIFKNGLFSKNPVLVQAVGLCPVVAVALSVKVGLALALISGVLLVAGELLAALVYKYIPKWLRVGVYALTFLLLIIPVFFFARRYTPNVFLSIGVFFPLMAVNSILIYRCDGFAVKHSVLDSLLDAIAYSLGYGAVLVIAGMLREVLGSGRFWGYSLGFEGITILQTPMGGFLILAFLSAGLWYMLGRRERVRQDKLELEDATTQSPEGDDAGEEIDILAAVRKVTVSKAGKAPKKDGVKKRRAKSKPADGKETNAQAKRDQAQTVQEAAAPEQVEEHADEEAGK